LCGKLNLPPPQNHPNIITIYEIGETVGMHELEKAFEARDYLLPRIKVEPFLDPLRGDPRFKVLLKRLNLPE